MLVSVCAQIGDQKAPAACLTEMGCCGDWQCIPGWKDDGGSSAAPEFRENSKWLELASYYCGSRSYSRSLRKYTGKKKTVRARPYVYVQKGDNN